MGIFSFSADKKNPIIFSDTAGNQITVADLADITGEVNYTIQGNGIVPQAAKQHHEAARALGQSGNYEAAIQKLEAAIQLAPSWAYPHYDMAFTYLLMNDNDKALEYYQQTDSLEPKGFFTSKTAIYTLAGEKAGKFPVGLYRAYIQLEWLNNPEEKLQVLQGLTAQLPDFAPAWKELSALLTDKALRLEAINQGLSKSPDAETKGILLINKAIMLHEAGEKSDAINLLGEMIFAADTTYGNTEMAKFVLKQISK